MERKKTLEAHRVKTLNSDGEALEMKRSFAWVAGDLGDAAAKVSKKGALVLMGPRWDHF